MISTWLANGCTMVAPQAGEPYPNGRNGHGFLHEEGVADAASCNPFQQHAFDKRMRVLRNG
jgi:hypothetical protein